MDNIKRFVNTSEDLQLLLSNHSVSGPGRLEILLKRGLYDKITIHQSNLTLTGENKSDTIVSGIVIKRNVSKIQLENLSVALDATVTVDEGLWARYVGWKFPSEQKYQERAARGIEP